MSDLDELKNLLFGAEKEALDTIAARVESREVRSADVADVLPEAIHQSHRKGGELVESLTEPVGECLQNAFRDDPETYGNALYPVIGPAIRKSIMHALRGFAQQINEAVEHSISPKGLKWRLQASRAGIPFGDFILQKTLLYRVEQAYLISRENGLLMSHVHHEASKIKDSDAVSAMFTAIQDFVKESFSPDRTGRLESADMGDFTLWAVHGPHALLVCVIRGIPPRSLRGDLSAILERIHFRYGDAIREYKGDTESVANVEEELVRCLRFEARQKPDDAKRRGLPVALLVILLLLLAAAVYLGVRNWQAAAERDALESALRSTAGIHVTELTRDGQQFAVRGLRDPLAPSIATIADGIDIGPDRLSMDIQPFQSLEPEIVVRRAERALARPDGVLFEMVDGRLRVTGEAPGAWIRRLEQDYTSVAGIDSIDSSALVSSDPAPVDPREQLLPLLRELDGARFYFSGGVILDDAAAASLEAWIAKASELEAQARSSGLELTARVLGSTDSSGNEAINARVAARRAEAVADLLRANGISVAATGRAPPSAASNAVAVDPQLRFVQVELDL